MGKGYRKRQAKLVAKAAAEAKKQNDAKIVGLESNKIWWGIEKVVWKCGGTVIGSYDVPKEFESGKFVFGLAMDRSSDTNVL